MKGTKTTLFPAEASPRKNLPSTPCIGMKEIPTIRLKIQLKPPAMLTAIGLDFDSKSSEG